MQFCLKKNSSNGDAQKTMEGDGKKSLKIVISEFYKLNIDKGKKGNWLAEDREALIRRIKIKQKEIDQDVVIKMFENLETKVHMAK